MSACPARPSHPIRLSTTGHHQQCNRGRPLAERPGFASATIDRSCGAARDARSPPSGTVRSSRFLALLPHQHHHPLSFATAAEGQRAAGAAGCWCWVLGAVRLVSWAPDTTPRDVIPPRTSHTPWLQPSCFHRSSVILHRSSFLQPSCLCPQPLAGPWPSLARVRWDDVWRSCG